MFKILNFYSGNYVQDITCSDTLCAAPLAATAGAFLISSRSYHASRPSPPHSCTDDPAKIKPIFFLLFLSPPPPFHTDRHDNCQNEIQVAIELIYRFRCCRVINRQLVQLRTSTYIHIYHTGKFENGALANFCSKRMYSIGFKKPIFTHWIVLDPLIMLISDQVSFNFHQCYSKTNFGKFLARII